MAIENREKHALEIDTGSIFDTPPSSKSTKKHTKIVVISENSSDIYMIQKFLPKEEGYMIYEAASLSSALKVMHYLNLDLILVDDKLSDMDGYDVVSKLNLIEISQDIPKIILLTNDYKSEKKESFHAQNVDFVKKPLDKVLFKLRVKSLIQNAQDRVDKRNYFKHLASQKFQEAQSLMHIYQEIFERSENIMCIYDATQEKIVEANAIFEKFFLNVNAFNRIVSNPRLVRKFVPVSDEANYLNYYHPKDWMQTLIEGESFTYLVQVQRAGKAYSFNISLQNIINHERGIYLLKLVNVYDYLPQKNSEKESMKLALKEKNLEAFRDDFLTLRNLVWQQVNQDQTMQKLLYQLSTKLSILCDDASIVQNMDKHKAINLYYVIVRLLKNKFSELDATINNQKVDSSLEENAQIYFSAIDGDALEHVLLGLLNHYHDEQLDADKSQKRCEMTLKEEEAYFTIQIIFTATQAYAQRREYSKDEIMDTLPKSMKQSLQKLAGDIKKVEQERQAIYEMTIPRV